jgi:hypothetical protein
MSPALTLDSLTYYLTSSSVPARPTAWVVSLHTAAPGNSGVANEVTDASYARQPVGFALDVSDASAPVASNASAVYFAAASSGYTAAYAVVWDASRNVPLVIQRLVTDKVIATGEQAQFSPGELKIGGKN